MKTGASENSISVLPWDPERHLRRVDSDEARLSRGFLRCRPEKWFPGFPAHWLPLAHSLGCETRLVEVKPATIFPQGLDQRYYGSVDGEPITVGLDTSMSQLIADEVAPGSSKKRSAVVLDYFMRRFIATLGLSWSGPQSSTMRYEREDKGESEFAGAVKVVVSVNTSHIVLWIGLGRRLVDQLDGLWRRQIQSSYKAGSDTGTYAVEIVQLGVPPQMLGDYLKRDTVIDLEIPVSETVHLVKGGKIVMPARLVNVDSRLGLEAVVSPSVAPVIPEGATKLSVQIGTVDFDNATLIELGQSGAIVTTDIETSPNVRLIISGDQVAEGFLCTYEGRFAVTVK